MTGSSSGRAHSRPVRIELATSEIEGSRCIGWADPSQVLAVVAISEPHDAFARHLEPILSEEPDTAEVAEDPSTPGASGAGGGLPPALQQLIRRLRGIHRRLHRENQSLMRDPRWVSLTCAFAEEERVYFVKGAPSRVFLLRDGKAYRAEEEEGIREGKCAALGRQEKLTLEVTSLPVLPGDTVVLLASESDVPPDLRALTSVFGQTHDLKRACDGLVNLLGLQSEGASAVALRFLAIGAERVGTENPLDDLASELVLHGGAPDGADRLEEAVCAGRGEAPAGSAAGDSRSAPVVSDSSAVTRENVVGDGASPCTDGPPAIVAGETKAVCQLVAGRDPAARTSKRRETGVFWSVLIVLLVAGLALLAAVPMREGTRPMGVRLYHWLQEQDIRSWIPDRGESQSGSSGGVQRGAGFGSLEVAPDPPARFVLLNGEVRASGTPVRLDGIPAGRHRIGLDLGPCGIWETELHVPRGETASLTPRLVGSVELVTADPELKGSVWTPGRDKVPSPARIDSLPVGWNRIFYEDERLPMWDRNVLVRAGETARVVVPNDFASDQGLVRISAMVFRPGDGLVDSVGDSIWVDGAFVGITPIEKKLSPGFHSIRVGRAGNGQYSEVLEVRAGSTRHVQGQLSSSPQPRILHSPPGRVWIRGPVLLSAEIRGGAGSVRPTLHLPELTAGSRQIPMTPVDQGRGVYVGVVDPESLPAGRTVSYYFTIQGSSGETAWSDLYRLECVEETPPD